MQARLPKDRTDNRGRRLAARHFLRLVREVGCEAMTKKRQYWTKMDHAEARNAIGMMSDEEAGRWLRGWLSGAAGEEALPSAPMEWRLGFSAGTNSLKDAEEFSRKQAERVSARYTKATAVDPEEESLPDATEATAVDPEAKNLPDLPITQHNTTQQTNKKEQQAPTREEWDEHAKANFPWWPKWDSDKAFAYWRTKDFTRDGKRARSDWRRLMGTWAGKWAESNQREFQDASARVLAPSGRQLPSGFTPRGKAPEV